MEFCNSFNRRRGILVFHEEKCTFCGLCARRCPHKALKVSPEKKEWRIKLICMKCGRCVRECPSNALTIEKEKENE